MGADVFTAAHAVLMCREPDDKVRLALKLAQDWRSAALHLDAQDVVAPEPIGVPGRPDRPELVPPRALAQRKLGGAEGRAVLVHAVAHIEFNAINLAADAVYRFRGMPRPFYDDWVLVAEDEARHFQMLNGRLAELGYAYGDFPAHDGLWQAACDTAHDVLIRMALVPRVLEARGLDVTPGMIDRLRKVSDHATADVLEVILREEVAHVAAGTRWFEHICAERGLEPHQTFIALLRRHSSGALRGPFNRPARQSAGFSDRDMAGLEQLAASTAHS
jgi:uncharacterized ferritin-like protein (DUF455 family)